MKIEAGKTYRIFYNKRNWNNRLIHVRAVIDDYYVVYRFWHAVQWCYKMDNMTYINLLIKNGTLTEEKKK